MNERKDDSSDIAGFDAVLARAAAAAPSVAASPELRARVLADAPHARRPSPIAGALRALRPFGPAWRPAVAFAAALILGVIAGYTAPLSQAGESEAWVDGEELASVAYRLDQGLEDIE